MDSFPFLSLLSLFLSLFSSSLLYLFSLLLLLFYKTFFKLHQASTAAQILAN